MKRTVGEHYALIHTKHYPWQCTWAAKKLHQGKHKALLGIGGNIGDTVQRFEHLYWYLRRSKKIKLLSAAPILRNPPFGFLEQADFYNSLLLVATSLTPRQLLYYILRVEKHYGRKRILKNGPRTLDIDIIFYDNISINTKELTIPHPRWMERDSVLIPLQLMKGQR